MVWHFLLYSGLDSFSGHSNKNWKVDKNLHFLGKSKFGFLNPKKGLGIFFYENLKANHESVESIPWVDSSH